MADKKDNTEDFKNATAATLGAMSEARHMGVTFSAAETPDYTTPPNRENTRLPLPPSERKSAMTPREAVRLLNGEIVQVVGCTEPAAVEPVGPGGRVADRDGGRRRRERDPRTDDRGDRQALSRPAPSGSDRALALGGLGLA